MDCTKSVVYPLFIFVVLIEICNSKTVRASSFSFSSYFGNHMVLQRGPKGASIWGHSTLNGDKVELYVDGAHSGSAMVSNGLWQGKVVDPGTENPVVITASSTIGNVTLHDVLFGDVWLCSGQSNMEYNVNGLTNHSAEVADAANYQNIRVFHVGRHTTLIEDDTLNSIVRPWSRPNQGSLPGFSAVCWLFGKYLTQNLKRPIGLIESNWGGTRIEAWSSKDALKTCSNHKRQAPNPNTESVLWNGMIHPILKTTIYGAIWYQGESNTDNPDAYTCQFPAMIDDWRQKFYDNSLQTTDLTFPFGFVQLAPWRPSPSASGFPGLRWAQTNDKGTVPNARQSKVFMAVSIDLPDFSSPFGSIHPRLKHDISARLTLSALAVAYNQRGVDYQGPFPTKFTPHHGAHTIEIEYDHGASPLDIRTNNNFEICCTSHNHVCSYKDSGWIAAPIKTHDTTTVSIDTSGCKLGQHSVGGVRYAWKESPCPLKQCAVYGANNNLPGPPFIHSAVL